MLIEDLAKEAINKENDKCPECNGSGKYQSGTMRVCNSCHGSGIKTENKLLGKADVRYKGIKLEPVEEKMNLNTSKFDSPKRAEPKMYEIWCNIKDHFYDYEGVNLLGSVEAESFQAACDRFFWNNGFYVSEDLAYKGCKLYKTQMEACCDGDEGVLS